MFVLVVIFLISDSTVVGCPANCKICPHNGNLQRCDECDSGYWLREDSYCSICPPNCISCTNTTHCTKCNAAYWGIRPNMICRLSCSKNCTASGCNDTTGHCYGCKPGFYGHYCDQNCNLCFDEQCDFRKCIVGCKEGYYESTDNDDFECKKCHDHCLSCQNQTLCTQCEKGFYLLSYQNGDTIFCSPCNPACEECISYNECICNPGKYGPTCSKDCNIYKCKTCIEVNSIVTCTECLSGYSLQDKICKIGTNVCSQYCTNSCDSNGDCLGECKDGWAGRKCTEQCANRCRKCNQNNENVCTICEGDFYTSMCTRPCSSHCLARSGLVNCDITNGTCLHGCDNGYWGDKCDKQCSDGCNSESCNPSNGFCDTCDRTHYGNTCKNKCSKLCIDNGVPFDICNQTNGKCLNGCEDLKRGDICEVSALATSPSTTDKYSMQCTDQCDSNTKSFLLGMLTGVGICMLLLLVVIALRQIRKIRQKENSNKHVMKEREYENTAVTMQAVSPDGDIGDVGHKQNTVETTVSVYERLDDDTRDDQHQYSGLERRAVRHGTNSENI